MGGSFRSRWERTLTCALVGTAEPVFRGELSQELVSALGMA